MLVGIHTRGNDLRGSQMAGAGGGFASLFLGGLRSAGGGSSRAGFGGFGRS